MIIYKITNKINGKIYIGQTITSLNRRLNNHFSLNRKTSNCALHNSIRKYGKENFIIDVIACAKNINDLNYLETFFITFYNSIAPFGYNLTFGGDNHKRSSETCLKISKAKRGISNFKLKNIPKTKEHKEKLRLAKLGKKQTKQHAENAAKARINKKLKPIIAFNGEESILFSGIKFAIEFGFEKSQIHRSLKNKNKYNGYIFYRIEEFNGC